MTTGRIALFDREIGCGCVQADGDRVVHCFYRACIAPDYLPRKGDYVAFNVRANPRSGGTEAFKIHLLAAA
jgi:hypothetical protein